MVTHLVIVASTLIPLMFTALIPPSEAKLYTNFKNFIVLLINIVEMFTSDSYSY